MRLTPLTKLPGHRGCFAIAKIVNNGCRSRIGTRRVRQPSMVKYDGTIYKHSIRNMSDETAISSSLELTRNIGVLAHVDAGETSRVCLASRKKKIAMITRMVAAVSHIFFISPRHI